MTQRRAEELGACALRGPLCRRAVLCFGFALQRASANHTHRDAEGPSEQEESQAQLGGWPSPTTSMGFSAARVPQNLALSGPRVLTIPEPGGGRTDGAHVPQEAQSPQRGSREGALQVNLGSRVPAGGALLGSWRGPSSHHSAYSCAHIAKALLLFRFCFYMRWL